MDTKTIAAYDRYTLDYDAETAYFWDNFPQDFISGFMAMDGHKILDVGSGPGRDAELLRVLDADVTCLDASSAMVAMCKKKGFKTVLADFNNIPFPNESFDGVWAYTSLLHIPKQEKSIPLSEIHRILKPNGRLALGMIQGGYNGYRTSSGIAEPRWFSFYEPAELEPIFRSVGFKIIKLTNYKPGEKLNYLNYILSKVL